MASARPRMLAATRTLRAKGEAGLERRIITAIYPDKRIKNARPKTRVHAYPSDARATQRSPRTSTKPCNASATQEARKAAVLVSTGDDQVYRLRPLAFLVGLDIERDALPLGQRLQSGALNGGDMHEYVPPAVIRLDETISALAIEEFDRTGHCHRENSYPRGCSAAVPPRHDSSAGHSHPGKASAQTGLGHSGGLSNGGRTSKPAR